jgi:hypothetical protein
MAAQARLREEARRRQTVNRKPLVNQPPAKRGLRRNPTGTTKGQAITALSKDPKYQALVNKLQKGLPLTKADKAAINQALGINNSLAFTNVGGNINSNNLNVFNNTTGNNVANVLAGLGGLFIGLGAAANGFPQGFVMDGGGVCGGGSDDLPPECPTTFFPTDPGAFDQSMADAGITDPGDYYMPPVSGVACAITPNLPQTYQDDPGIDAASADPTFADAGDGSSLGDVAVDDPQGRFTTRYLRVGNDTNEAVDIFVQYKTTTEQGDQWFPADPANSDEAIGVSLAPGESADIKEGDWRVNASAVRIWAKSPTREWNMFKTQDLPLVPEVDESGTDHAYLSNDLQVFNWTVR